MSRSAALLPVLVAGGLTDCARSLSRIFGAAWCDGGTLTEDAACAQLAALLSQSSVYANSFAFPVADVVVVFPTASGDSLVEPFLRLPSRRPLSHDDRTKTLEELANVLANVLAGHVARGLDDEQRVSPPKLGAAGAREILASRRLLCLARLACPSFDAEVYVAVLREPARASAPTPA